VTNKISGYPAAAPLAPIKGATNGTAAPTDKSQGDAPANVAATPAKPGEQLTLTDSARHLQKIEAAVAKAPVVNAAKLASVKLAVQNGTYQIDAGRVASKIVKFDGELG
jgi:negative regulator of flagellin synthesis FlgM